MLSFQYINEVKRLRKASGISQRNLSELSGIPQSTLSSIESHNCSIKLDDAERLALCLNTNIIEVLTSIYKKER